MSADNAIVYFVIKDQSFGEIWYVSKVSGTEISELEEFIEDGKYTEAKQIAKPFLKYGKRFTDKLSAEKYCIMIAQAEIFIEHGIRELFYIDDLMKGRTIKLYGDT